MSLRSIFPSSVLLFVVVGCVADGGNGDDGVGGTGDAETSDTDTDTAADTGDTGTTGDTGDAGTTDTTDTTSDTGTAGDATAQAACEAFAGATPQAVIAAASAGEAATAPIVADPGTVYAVTLPEGSEGFLELQIADWDTTQAFFTVADIDYTVTVVDNSQIAEARGPDLACPEAGITDQRIHFPHWTPATVAFSATGPRDVLLMVIQEP